MRYWYAPLQPEPGNIFKSEKNCAGLYVGEITKDVYDRILKNRRDELKAEPATPTDEFGLPLDTDEFGLPI